MLHVHVIVGLIAIVRGGRSRSKQKTLFGGMAVFTIQFITFLGYTHTTCTCSTRHCFVVAGSFCVQCGIICMP